ncbi:MAG: isoleucine--tRNA ligase [Elusimicrobia bacterium]|nr:isoleucine--tRNA ligase [Elusimicrobiota bacterium]
MPAHPQPNLPQTAFPMKADLPRREPAILQHWAAIHDQGQPASLYEALIRANRAKPNIQRFVLHDGPPYANGHLHMGHALNKILKDLIVKYRAMSGCETPYIPGWDCHGLPIELELMKKLKVDKHKISREEFRKKAAAFAQEFVDIQREEFKRMGVLGDWEHPYLTMDEGYKQTIVNTFRQLQDKGYIARWKKPVYWCTSCETALADAEVEYEEIVSPSIHVRFPVKEGYGDFGERGVPLSAVIWTTTPWTLPANVAIAFNPKANYARIKGQQRSGSGHPETFIILQDRLEEVRKQLTEVELEKGSAFAPITGEFLVDYEPRGTFAHPFLPDKAIQPLGAEFVSTDKGTGAVHIAPGHGEEDYRAWHQETTEDFPCPVDERGNFTQDVGVPTLVGKNVLRDANDAIIQLLQERRMLLGQGSVTHSYPHCWRCHQPVIFRATDQWFLKIDHDNLRQKLLDQVKQVRWVPAFGQNRIAGMIESRPDWCLSRQRLWGTPIPSEPTQKEPDILDVWFESGVSWAAVLEQRPELAYPADLYLEGSDQHRGWFQTSLIPSVALEGKAPYKAVLTHGFVVDGEGRKMSKSLGNVIAPQEVIERYGADILRLWVASSDYREDVRMSEDILKGLVETYRKLRNTLRYLLANLYDFQFAQHDVLAHSALCSVDRWALHRLQQVVQQVNDAFEAYEFHRAVAVLSGWCITDLSSVYFDVLKDRLYTHRADHPERRAAQSVLYEILFSLLRMLTPVLSFTAEEAWAEFRRGPARSARRLKESVFLESFPKPDQRQWLAPEEEADWDLILRIRDVVNQELEVQRRLGKIKASLEANLMLVAPDKKHMEFLKRYEHDWPMLTITSPPTTLNLGAQVTDSFVTVHAARAPGEKCQLCWRYTQDVETQPGGSNLCGRCRMQHLVVQEKRSDG